MSYKHNILSNIVFSCDHIIALSRPYESLPVCEVVAGATYAVADLQGSWMAQETTDAQRWVSTQEKLTVCELGAMDEHGP